MVNTEALVSFFSVSILCRKGMIVLYGIVPAF